MIRKASKIRKKLGNLIGRYQDLLIFFFLLYFTLLALLTPLGKAPSVTTVGETGSEVGSGTKEDNRLVEKAKPIRVLEGLRVNTIVEAEGEVWCCRSDYLTIIFLDYFTNFVGLKKEPCLWTRLLILQVWIPTVRSELVVATKDPFERR
jgi:hypothetical protein